MITQIHCPVYHDTDGACCDGDKCGYDVSPVRREPLPAAEIARINAGIHRDMLFVVLGLFFIFVGGAWALATLENQQKHYDLINQENVR